MTVVRTRATLLPVLVWCALAGSARAQPQPTGVAAVHRSGQTFVTWTERGDLAGERYRIYRHASPITPANLGSAVRLYELWEGSGRFFADRTLDDGGVWVPRYLERFVIGDGGAPLAAGTGLLVWTLAAVDLGGALSGQAYYAVTTVNAAGQENVVDLTAGNTVGPVAEQVADPAPVEVNVPGPGGGHVFVQYMSLREWNPTFHAPNPGNGFYGLDPADPEVGHAVQVAYTYSVGEPTPATCEGTVPSTLPVVVNLHGWNGNTYPAAPGPSEYYCAFEIRPVDTTETWWFGFARTHDFRLGGTPQAGDEIVSFTERRVLRMVHDLLRHPTLGSRADPERVFVYGHSMGGSGTLALALRYPNVFAAAYASEPMTDYATSGNGGGVDWRDDAAAKWGSPSLDLPIRIDAPGGWAAHLQSHTGTGVWTWQNHRATMTTRVADSVVPLGLAHGRQDTVIEWTTQGKPFYAAANASHQPWGGYVVDADHTWLSFQGLPPTIGLDSSLAPFAGFQVRLHETVPGLANASGDLPLPPPDGGPEGGYNQAIEWSASWSPWDGPPVDTAGSWGVSLRTVDGGSRTVDVTPRRAQHFQATPGATFGWENRSVADDSMVASGQVVADAHGLVTVPAFAVTAAGNRLRLTAGGGGNSPPTARLSASARGGRVPRTITFDGGASTDADGTIASYHWAFGDGGSGTGAQVSHTYTAAGLFVVTLTVTDDDGAASTVQTTLKLSPAQGAPRPWPDTTRGVHVFRDQLAPGTTDAQVAFAATHYDGTQKMTRREADRLRAVNPDLMILHYRLGMGLGYRAPEAGCAPTGDWLRIVEGDDWVVEWPGDAAVQETWLHHWPEASATRVFNCDWGWYLGELNDPGWRAFWRGEVRRQIAANDDDGVFMDSLSVPNYLGFDHWNPALPAVDAGFESAWSTRLATWLGWLAAEDPAAYWIVPNVGAWNTTRETTDYSSADGLMVEGFALEGDASPYALDDWRLQMSRALAATRRGQAILAQTYVAGASERMFTLGSHLLVKGDRTYLTFENGPDPDWWPEYAVPVGAPTAPPVADIALLDSDGDSVYRRDFDNGLVLVNPTSPGDGSAVTRVIALGGTRYLALGSGGGPVGSNGETTAGLTYQAVTEVTLPPTTAAVLFNALPGQQVRGDANHDGSLGVADVFYLINALFAGGPAPTLLGGDANSDGTTTVADVFFLINHLFAGGPAPA